MSTFAFLYGQILLSGIVDPCYLPILLYRWRPGTPSRSSPLPAGVAADTPGRIALCLALSTVTNKNVTWEQVQKKIEHPLDYKRCSNSVDARFSMGLRLLFEYQLVISVISHTLTSLQDLKKQVWYWSKIISNRTHIRATNEASQKSCAN